MWAERAAANWNQPKSTDGKKREFLRPKRRGWKEGSTLGRVPVLPLPSRRAGWCSLALGLSFLICRMELRIKFSHEKGLVLCVQKWVKSGFVTPSVALGSSVPLLCSLVYPFGQ